MRPSSINPLIEEFDDILDSEHDSNNFRHRHLEGNGKLHHSPLLNSVVKRSENENRRQFLSKSPQHSTWNMLNTTLFVGLALLSAATSTSITLVPSMSLAIAATNGNEEWEYSPYYNLEVLEVYDGNGERKRWIPFRIRTRGASNSYDQNISSSSIFASQLTSIVTLVTAFGKFINGALVDVAGARRLLLIYGTCTCLALMGLRTSTTPNWAIGCCAAVEFFSSINWSAAIVVLGAHYGGLNGNESDGNFERGLYVISLASRCGSLLAIPLSSLLMKWTDLTWRGVAGLASWAAMGGVTVFYFKLTDSPGKVHDPQNPIRTMPNSIGDTSVAQRHSLHPSFHLRSPIQTALPQRVVNFVSSVVYTVLPSIRAILLSRVFWAVAMAHAGATMVKSSERILGTYFRDTSYGVATESKAGAMTVFLSLGMLAGLFAGGKAFTRAADSEQRMHTKSNVHHPDHTSGHELYTLTHAAQIGTKNMIAFFYCLSICMCYTLAFFAVPVVRKALHLPVLVLILQVMATLGLGFGVAVQYYHIPAIVSATYGKNRGVYIAYTDGVAALVSSIVWRIVGGAVEEGNPQGGGWAYGWAAVALLLIFCGTLMLTILEVYFVGGGWCHDTPKARHECLLPTEPANNLNRSWMDASPHRTPGRLNALSSSALEFIGSPGKIQIIRQKPLITVDDSRDEDGTANNDLLGVDDDGSFLFPSSKNIVSQNGGMHDFLDFSNSAFESMSKEIRDSDGCIRESSVFDDLHDRPYNNGPFQSFEL